MQDIYRFFCSVKMCWIFDTSSLCKTIDDPSAVMFMKEIERVKGDVSMDNISPYITSKFSRFTNDTRLKRIIGQSHSSLNFGSIMNDGKVLLMKLGRGRFGPTISALIANKIVSRFKMAAMKRGEPASAENFIFMWMSARRIQKKSSARYCMDYQDIDKHIFDRLNNYEKMVA